MRPLYLEMQGFGPYGEKVTIDFTKFADGGLYLVTGETGSGKTFIFDGICYALFGKVSGEERKIEMLRTTGLDTNIETYVKLKFICKNKEYEITRKPAYEREKKRGTGTVTDNARVEFSDGIGTWTRTEEVDKKIYEIIGLTDKQFKQIVMIAQGKFAQILQKSTKERRELLREIFNTNIYLELEKNVKTEHDNLVNEYNNRKGEITDKLQEISASDPTYNEQLSALQQAEFIDVAKVLELTQIFENYDKELLKKYTAQEEQLLDEQTKLQLILDKITKRETQEKKLAQLLKECEKETQTAKEKKIKAEKVHAAMLFLLDSNQQKVTLEATLESLRNLYSLYNKLEKSNNDLMQDEKNLQNAIAIALKKQEIYNTLYHNFLLAQAGLLAANLHEGGTCPVCGSKDHPKLAILSKDAPKENNVNEAKKDFDNAEAERQRCLANKEKDAKTKAEKLEEFKLAVNDFYGDEFTNIDVNILAKKILDDGKKNKSEIADLDAKIKNKKSELGMNNNDNIEQFAKNIQEEETKAREKVANLNGAIKNLREEMAETENITNKEEYQKKSQENKNELAICKNEKEKVTKRQIINKQAANAINLKHQQMLDIENKRSEIDNLYRTLSGNLNTQNATKLSFETYMQQAYFDKVLAYANNRLLKISHGRYKLVRKNDGDSKGNAKVGLDLNVHDFHSGKERNANSLSGGETFMASLSLALGMADEVQASAGGIHIETMFIDEGFGSLSHDYLNSTIDVLNTLADNKHLVGIISHIEELKERIDQQIVVTKNTKGYSEIKVEI